MASQLLEIGGDLAFCADADPRATADGLSLLDWPEYRCASAIAEWNALALAASEPNSFFESWSLLPALANLDR